MAADSIGGCQVLQQSTTDGNIGRSTKLLTCKRYRPAIRYADLLFEGAWIELGFEEVVKALALILGERTEELNSRHQVEPGRQGKLALTVTFDHRQLIANAFDQRLAIQADRIGNACEFERLEVRIDDVQDDFEFRQSLVRVC